VGFYEVLRDLFDCEQPACWLVEGLVNHPELALPQTLPQDELVNLHILYCLLRLLAGFAQITVHTECLLLRGGCCRGRGGGAV
jgi:hypothetical protein